MGRYVQTVNILIIGGEAAVRRYVHGSLVDPSYRYTWAATAGEAETIMRRVGVDAALLDLVSVGASAGLHLATSLRRELTNLPIVVVASAPGTAYALEAMQLGVTDYLLEPVSPAELRAAVERAIEWRRNALHGDRATERLAREMSARSAALAHACVESGIASAVALEAWVSTLYRRDPWALRHVTRVADLSVLIATMLGAEPQAVHDIGRAALLHDVGRLAVPLGVVRKTSPLTEDEQTLVRTYVQANYEVAMAVPYLRPLAVMLFTVRERYDGSGYPLGLRGAAIPLGSRVIALAEAFDSLAPEDADASVVDRANAALVDAAGVLFDPVVVQAWLRCLDSGVRR